MQSSIFGGGHVDKEHIQFDASLPKSNFSSQANWMDEGAYQRPDNQSQMQDAWQMRVN